MIKDIETSSDAGSPAHGKLATAIRVVVVEESALMRQGLAALIDGTRGFSCIDTYAAGDELVKALARTVPDVVLLNLGQLKMRGIEAIRAVRREAPGAAVLTFTSPEDEGLVLEALRAGARGYLALSTPPVKILEAIEEAAGGGSPMCSAIASQVVELFYSGKVRLPVEVESTLLTKREKDVLKSLADGKSYKEIAKVYGMSVNTVRFHIRNLYTKLEVSSQAEAVAKGLRQGLI